jgi:PhnB protein
MTSFYRWEWAVPRLGQFRFQPMRSVYLSLNVDTEAEWIYKLLSDGGEIFMPMQETFFASRFGQFRDRFGISWMILHERPMPPSR